MHLVDNISSAISHPTTALQCFIPDREVASTVSRDNCRKRQDKLVS